MVKKMCIEAGIEKKTNHSLRATGASALFQANVPERIIQKTTGHRSVDALRSYEKISVDQYKAVSKVLMTNSAFDSHENARPQPQDLSLPMNMARVFGNLTNCTIGKMTVNINPSVYSSSVEDEFDKLFSEN